MFRLLLSRGFLFFILCLQGAFIWVAFRFGLDAIKREGQALIAWLLGGGYSGQAVLSVAFAMNTWGVAVRSVRNSAKKLCRDYVAMTMGKLRDAGFANDIEKQVMRSFSLMSDRKRAESRMRAFVMCMERYEKMMPEMLNLSTEITLLLMILSASISVLCMIFEINGRFAAFLLLPFPLYCIYAWLAPRWVHVVLWYRWMMLECVLPNHDAFHADELNELELKLMKLKSGVKPERK